jgi:hypothetical protein
MRTGRLLAEEGSVEACYHCVTRVVERRFAFGDGEKEKFVEILRAYEELLLGICFFGRVTGNGWRAD